MKTVPPSGCPGGFATRWAGVAAKLGAMGLAMTLLVGCGQRPLPATVEGTLSRAGKPLDNCLVIFLPETPQDAGSSRFVGLTDELGRYRLRCDRQREGASVGEHRIVVEDLSVSTGISRRDHGAVDAEREEVVTPPLVRRSRVPDNYSSASQTPLRKEVTPGHQVIDLQIP